MVDGGGWLGRDPREEKPTADDAEPRTSLRYLAGCLLEIFHHHLTLCTLTLIGTCPVSLNSINTHVVTDNKKKHHTQLHYRWFQTSRIPKGLCRLQYWLRCMSKGKRILSNRDQYLALDLDPVEIPTRVAVRIRGLSRGQSRA